MQTDQIDCVGTSECSSPLWKRSLVSAGFRLVAFILYSYIKARLPGTCHFAVKSPSYIIIVDQSLTQICEFLALNVSS